MVNMCDILQAIDKFHKVQFLLHMTKKDINNLPLLILLKYADRQIDDAWHLLPERYQNNVDVQNCKRCLKHYQNDVGDVNDGKTPMIKDCIFCNENK